MLSHAAVISREYGIPAVLNLPGATQEIVTGMKVRLDGATGRIELIV
jgi:phosphohistidine swiveling domain-containing protein